MESLHLVLGKTLDYLLSFIKLDGVLLENGVRLSRLSRSEWEYSKNDIRIRFVAEMGSGKYNYIVYRSDMWFNMNYGNIYDSAEIRNRVIRPDNKVNSVEIQQEIAEAFLMYQRSIGRTVLID